MRLCELSTGLRFAGAGGSATGRVVDGRGPEDTIKREKISTTCLVLCCSLYRHLQHHNTKRLPKAELCKLVLPLNLVYSLNLKCIYMKTSCLKDSPFHEWGRLWFHDKLYICGVTNLNFSLYIYLKGTRVLYFLRMTLNLSETNHNHGLPMTTFCDTMVLTLWHLVFVLYQQLQLAMLVPEWQNRASSRWHHPPSAQKGTSLSTRYNNSISVRPLIKNLVDS